MTTIVSAIKLSGRVERFEGKGRKFGYPTANIQDTTDLREGVYFGYANLGEYKNCAALIFVGTPTTVGATRHRVEAHLLDINDMDYYGEILELEVCHFHRHNNHFESIDELLKAMKIDEHMARIWFKKRSTK